MPPPRSPAGGHRPHALLWYHIAVLLLVRVYLLDVHAAQLLRHAVYRIEWYSLYNILLALCSRPNLRAASPAANAVVTSRLPTD